MLTLNRVDIHRATLNDLPLVLRAQRASHWEMTPYSAEEVRRALDSGVLEAYILTRHHETGTTQTIVAVNSEGADAMLCGFHRVGRAEGLRDDAGRLLGHVREVLRERGVQRMYACISRKNPLFAKLVKFYRRLEFEADLIRMGQEV